VSGTEVLVVVAGIAAMAGGSGICVAVLVRLLARNRISQRVGIIMVILGCLLWHAVAAWMCLYSPHHAMKTCFTFFIGIPYGFGLGTGMAAFFAALAVQATVAAALGTGLYQLLRRHRREPRSGR
jgi:hypothetical protein